MNPNMRTAGSMNPSIGPPRRLLFVAGVAAAAMAVVFALTLTGPRYMSYCVGGAAVSSGVCVSKDAGSSSGFGSAAWQDQVQTRQLGLFERAWYSLAGSKNTYR